MKVLSQYKPNLHYAPKYGWINDPNGVSYYNNQYHLFAQHYPHDSVWGPMHWSHAVSDDLITWTHLDVALTPDSEYDKGGCFSGSAIEIDGKHVLYYTSVESDGNQQQSMAIGDGLTYQKYEHNPIIKSSDLPEKYIRGEFRDPKVIKRNDKYYMLLGTKTKDKCGALLVFISEDGYKWIFLNEVIASDEFEDGVYECPDLITIGGKDVLIYSPINKQNERYKYLNVSSTVYEVGVFDLETGVFTSEYKDELDFGFDYYAPQVYCNNGKYYIIAWMQLWGKEIPTNIWNHGWAGQMTLPRELTLEDNQLKVNYPAQLEDYITSSRVVSENDGTIQTDPSVVLKISGNNLNGKINISSQIIVSIENDAIVLDRSAIDSIVKNVDGKGPTHTSRSIEGITVNSLVAVIDSSSVEFFINEKYTMTTTFYPEQCTLELTGLSNAKATLCEVQSDV